MCRNPASRESAAGVCAKTTPHNRMKNKQVDPYISTVFLEMSFLGLNALRDINKYQPQYVFLHRRRRRQQAGSIRECQTLSWITKLRDYLKSVFAEELQAYRRGTGCMTFEVYIFSQF